MPPKGSRALNEKNSFLGVFQNNKKEINGMDKIIFEQKEVMEAKKIELKRINEELQDISREISYFSGEINKKRRKLLHQKSLLQDLNSSIQTVGVDIKSCKRKNVFQISSCIKKKRILNPTNHSTPLHSKLICRKETFEACSAIHGGSSIKPEPIIEGMLDTLTSKFKTKQISDSIFSGKQSLVNTIQKMFPSNGLKDFIILKKINCVH